MRIYYEVVGESFYRQNIQMLGDRNMKYDIPNAKLQQIAAGTVVYEYYFNNLYPQIFAEPNNPHDRNALRVDINGLTVGYISRDENIECANILSHSKFIMTARIKGGRSKTVSSTNIILNEYDFRVTLCVDISSSNYTPSQGNTFDLKSNVKNWIKSKLSHL